MIGLANRRHKAKFPHALGLGPGLGYFSLGLEGSSLGLSLGLDLVEGLGIDYDTVKAAVLFI